MDVELLKKFTRTDICNMIGDVNNLDWMDFERLKDDVTTGCYSNGEKWIIVIKYQIELKKNTYFSHVQCCFQPYEKNTNSWVSNTNTIPFINSRYGMNQSQIELIKGIVEGKIETIRPNHLPYHIRHVGKRIATPETWRRKKAIDTIIRNWLICRYNPKYKMCETVLWNNIEEARKEYENSINFIHSLASLESLRL
jgi:hypothetical protein